MCDEMADMIYRTVADVFIKQNCHPEGGLLAQRLVSRYKNNVTRIGYHVCEISWELHALSSPILRLSLSD